MLSQSNTHTTLVEIIPLQELAKITVAVADDEPLARQGMLARISSFSQLEVVASFSNGPETLDYLNDCPPDAIFLDIEMPGINGVDIVREVLRAHSGEAQHRMPYVVFTTAHQEFAVDAFELGQCDYLLKPITQERLEACVHRLQKFAQERLQIEQHEQLQQLLPKKVGKSLDSFLDNLSRPGSTRLSDIKTTISVKIGSEWLKLPLKDIDWIEAAGDYLCVHVGEQQHIVRKTMKQMEQELPAKQFPRLNRSAIVNIDKLSRLSPNSNGEYSATLTSGAVVKVSRKYKFKLDELQGNHKSAH